MVIGTVTQVGEQAADIGRQAVLLAGWPVTVPAVTVNRFCGSSQEAVHMAARAIEAGDMRYAIGGGVESMSRVPMFSDLGGGGGLKGLCPDLWDQLRSGGAGRERRAGGRPVADHPGASRRLGRREPPPGGRGSQAGATAEILPTPGHDAQGPRCR